MLSWVGGPRAAHIASLVFKRKSRDYYITPALVPREQLTAVITSYPVASSNCSSSVAAPITPRGK